MFALLPHMPAAAATKEISTTYYRLDTGVTFLWKNSAGVWQKGWEPGGSYVYSAAFSIPRNAKNVRVDRYNKSNFVFGPGGQYADGEGDGRKVYNWNPTAYAHDKSDYDANYDKYSASPLSVSGADSYNPANGGLTVTYTATFSKSRGIDVKEALTNEKKDYIYGLLGSPSRELIDAMNLLDPQSQSFSPNVEGYLWFLPIVIRYDLTEKTEIPDDAFEAALSLPATARIGESYTVADVSVVGGDATVVNAELNRHYGDGKWEPAAIWPGRGKGQNSGGKKSETASRPGEITYRLVVTASDGRSDTDTKKIRILEEDEEAPKPEESEKPDVGMTAMLNLPASVYEGHSVRASDISAYSVDGKDYSAARMYSEGRARNEFRTSSEAGASQTTLTSTERDISWPKIGEYEVTLRISANSDSDTDTMPIEVLKTPSVAADLGGAQKQNRKQTLFASIATNPLYPIRTAWMEITEKTGGESVKLYMGGTLQNSDNIKTRAVKDADSDAFFTNIELPFLTKYNETREFSYTIFAEDSRGYTDTVTNDFTVVPDLPPVPEIFLPTEFLREKGGNIAKIEAFDKSETDSGDQLERTWYVSYPGPGGSIDFVDASGVAGYEDMSFGSGQSIVFEKTGVGPVSVKLRVKDVWTDETLPEYISGDEYLSAESEISSAVVQNIAPVVTLSAKPTKSADLLLLAASDAEYNALSSRKNEIDRVLTDKGIDAKLSVKKLDKPAGYGFYTLMNAVYPLGAQTVLSGRYFSLDDAFLYTVNGTWNAAKSRLSAPYYLTAYDARTGAAKWAYTINESNSGLFKTGEFESSFVGCGHDANDKYLFLRFKSKTLIFDKQTGAYLTKIDSVFGEYNCAAANAIYTLRSDGVYKLKLSGGTATRVFSGGAAGESRLVGGKARFFTQTAPNAYIADFDPVTEKTTLIKLPGIIASADNFAAGIDSAGNILVSAASGSSFFDKTGRLVKTLPAGAYPIRNGAGEITYAACGSWRNGSSDSYTMALYELCSDKVFIHTQSANELSYMPIIAGFDEGQNTVSVQRGLFANDLGSGYGLSEGAFGNSARAGSYVVNTATGNVRFTARSDYLAYDDGRAEYAKTSDALYAVGWDYSGYGNPPPEDDAKVRTAEIPRTEDQVLAQTVMSLATGDATDIRAAILLDDSGSSFGSESAELASALGNAGFIKLSGSGSALLANTIAERIETQGNTEQKTAVIKRTADAETGSISRSFALDPQKTYYYEYETHGGETKERQPLSITFDCAKTVGDDGILPGKLYVQKTYFEDFNGGPTTGFFSGFSNDRISDGVYKASYGTGAEAFTFTVPSGTRGILSFDYSAASNKSGHFVIDGDIWDVVAVNGHYTHKYPLEPGAHTLESRLYHALTNDSKTFRNMHMKLDNLKLELVGVSEPDVRAWGGKAEDAGGGWTKYSGSFNTPNSVFSYAAQTLEVWEGPYRNNPYVTANITDGYMGASTLTVNIPYGRYALDSAVGLSAYARPGEGYYSTEGASISFTAGYSGADPTRLIYGMLPIANGSSGPVTVSGSWTHANGNGRHMSYTNVNLYLANEMNDAIARGDFTLDRAAGRVYFADEIVSGARLTFSSAAETLKIKNFSLYYLENGVKTYLTRNSLESASEAAAWTSENATLAVADEKPAGDEKEKGALIYKKGQLVAYNISYTDYENDPSKAEFWRYTHTPFNDGEHPDAAVIMDRNGEIVTVSDNVLSEGIDRFHIDGKYVVEHWQTDNTDRTNAGNGAVNYGDFNRYSNTETLTFYIEGGGEAPWVTGIKTNPDPVAEGGGYRLEVGVDDLEKNELTVLVEVYFEGKEVYRYRKEGVEANGFGVYPAVITELAPAAAQGDYTVVATVWDEDGTGLGSHVFSVELLGRITGMVRHTEQWNENRRIYNTKLFGDAYDALSVFDAYRAESAPRKRGTNVYWSGERFMLEAAVAGGPERVTCQIDGYPSYIADLTRTGRMSADGDAIYGGSLWNGDMVNRWGRNAPVEIGFIFTAFYDGDVTKTYEETVIADTYEDYRQLHRNF
jgi:hypothetical protein